MMFIKQKEVEFRTITIELEDRSEAEALFDLIDKLDNCCTNEGGDLTNRSFSPNERKLIVWMSNARTNGLIDI